MIYDRATGVVLVVLFLNKGRRRGRQIFIQLKYSLHYAVQCHGEKDFKEKKLQDRCQEDELN
jgi:hypothetical protein